MKKKYKIAINMLMKEKGYLWCKKCKSWSDIDINETNCYICSGLLSLIDDED